LDLLQYINRDHEDCHSWISHNTLTEIMMTVTVGSLTIH